jgi:hypothetical protein
MAYRGPSRALQGISTLAVAMAGVTCQAQAAPPEKPGPQHLEIWSGGEGFDGVWSAYGGASWAPFGSVREDGFRVRVVLGTGGYQGGDVAFGDLLVGYHKQIGPLTLKLFGGVVIAEHLPTQSTSMLTGTALGPKAVVETWWTITDRVWTSVDLSIALPHMHLSGGDGDDADRIDYTGRMRFGWRPLPKLWPELSVGLEGGAGGPLAPALQTTLQGSKARAGGFLRYEWASGEVSISGGLLSDGHEQNESHAQPYGTVSVLTRF